MIYRKSREKLLISQCILLEIKGRFVNTEYRVSAKIREQTAFSLAERLDEEYLTAPR